MTIAVGGGHLTNERGTVSAGVVSTYQALFAGRCEGVRCFAVEVRDDRAELVEASLRFFILLPLGYQVYGTAAIRIALVNFFSQF